MSAGAAMGERARWQPELGALLEMEAKRTLFGKRALAAWFLAATPPAIFLLVAVLKGDAIEIDRVTPLYAGIYRGLILQLCVFFGCAWLFSNAFRGEILERSLHYLFLSPARRELVTVAKYLSALVAAWALFGASTVLTYLAMLSRQSSSVATTHLFERGGIGHLGAWLAVTLLACVGYGAVFLLVGQISKSPFVPALAIWAWEQLNFLLPPFLKKVSVIFYLVSLTPVPAENGPFAVIADPAPAWVSVPAILILAAVFVTLAAWKAKRMEVSYGGE